MPLLGSGNPYATTSHLIRGLPVAMRADRELNTLSFTAQAALVGVGSDTLLRLDAGSNPAQSTVLACCDYLGRQ
jgi:hypothetical protein